MRTKKRLTRFFVSTLTAAVAVCSLISVKSKNVDVYAQVQELETILPTYVCNEIFTVPDAKIVHDGNSYDATDSVIIYPDGNAYKGGVHTLTQEGEYVVKYTAEVAGKRLIAEKKFTATPSFYSFEATGKDTNSLKSASCMFVNEFEMTPENENSGLRVSIPVDTKFQMNKVVDLTELGDQPIITIYPYNNTFLLGRNGKTVEAHDIVVTLTDCNDSNNYVELQYHWTTRQQTNYFAPILYYMAGSCGSERTSFITGSEEDGFEYNGKLYKKNRSGFGAYSIYDRSDVYGELAEDGTVTVTRPGNKQQLNICDEYVKSCGFSFYFDNQTGEVHAGEILGGTSVQTPRFVTNVNQAEVYGEKAFKGFSTGQVYISVHAENYNTSNAYAESVFATNMEIGSLGGLTGAQLNGIENTAKDTTSPYIVLGGVESAEQILQVQQGETVYIPQAQAFDRNLKTWTTSVYFNYGSKNQVSIGYTNGTFIAEKVGTYTIIYRAEDTFGNVATKTLYIISRRGAENNPISFAVEKVTSVGAGEALIVPTAEFSSKNVGAFLEVYYAFDGEDYTLAKDGQFFVEHVGKYSIKYVYGDLVHKKEYEYKLNATASDAVTFGESYLPKYFIKGAKYTLDDLRAYVYTDTNPTETMANVYVSEDGGAFTLVDGQAYTVNARESVQVRYERNGKTTETKTVPVVDVGFDNGQLDKGAYFQSELFTRKSDYEGTEYVSERIENNMLEYVNTVSLSNFSFEYIVKPEYANFKYLELVLTDYYDEDNRFVVRAQRNSQTGGISFNIGDTYAYSSTPFVNSVCLFYYKSNKIFFGSSSINIGTTFTSDKAFFSIRLTEVTGTNGIKIRQIGNSVFDSATYDALPALLSFASNHAVAVKQNEVVAISAVNVFDTFTPFVKENLTLYVTAPDGTYVQSLEGVLLERACDPLGNYSFAVEQTGMYWIYYEYTDQFDNTTMISASISIKDNQPPTITVDDGYNGKTVISEKLNATHSLHGYTISDNKTKTERLNFSIVILKPTGEIFVWDDDEITLDAVGEWRVIYYCIDGDGNAATEYYKIKVQ